MLLFSFAFLGGGVAPTNGRVPSCPWQRLQGKAYGIFPIVQLPESHFQMVGWLLVAWLSRRQVPGKGLTAPVFGCVSFEGALFPLAWGMILV